MLPQKAKTVVTIYKVMAWITIILGTLGSIIAMISGGLVTGVLAMGDDSWAAIAGGLTIVFGLIGIVMSVIFGILYFMIAKHLPLKKDWARILAIIFGILMLFSFPIGTVLGIILLINIFSDEFKAWWEGSPS